MLSYKYMKIFLKKLLVIVCIITAFSATISITNSTPTYARDFLGMPSWDDGVQLEGEKNQDQLTKDIVKIASNILTDLSVIASYGLPVYAPTIIDDELVEYPYDQVVESN